MRSRPPPGSFVFPGLGLVSRFLLMLAMLGKPNSSSSTSYSASSSSSSASFISPLVDGPLRVREGFVKYGWRCGDETGPALGGGVRDAVVEAVVGVLGLEFDPSDLAHLQQMSKWAPLFVQRIIFEHVRMRIRCPNHRAGFRGRSAGRRRSTAPEW